MHMRSFVLNTNTFSEVESVNDRCFIISHYGSVKPLSRAYTTLTKRSVKHIESTIYLHGDIGQVKCAVVLFYNQYGSQ